MPRAVATSTCVLSRLDAETRLKAGGLGWGFLLAGHGLYAWGADTQEALRHLDAFDYLFTLMLKMKGIPA